MRTLRDGLGASAVLVVCLAVSVGARLVASALPLLVAAFALATLATFLLVPRRRR